MSRQTDLDAAIDATTANLKWAIEHDGPDITTPDGELYHKQDYIDRMTNRLEQLLSMRQRVDAPFRVRTRLISGNY